MARAKRAARRMTTLTALVLRGHAFTLAHVGDTRAWLLRGGPERRVRAAQRRTIASTIPTSAAG